MNKIVDTIFNQIIDNINGSINPVLLVEEKNLIYKNKFDNESLILKQGSDIEILTYEEFEKIYDTPRTPKTE